MQPITLAFGRLPTCGDVVIGATLLDEILLAGRLQLEAGVLAHRLVQAVPGQPVDVVLERSDIDEASDGATTAHSIGSSAFLFRASLASELVAWACFLRLPWRCMCCYNTYID